MRFVVLILAVLVAACASHSHPKKTPQELVMVAPEYPPTEERCSAQIQEVVDRMKAVDFNEDRRPELKRYVRKARAELAKGRYDKCISIMKQARYW